LRHQLDVHVLYIDLLQTAIEHSYRLVELLLILSSAR
jgi:hypothetical protein